MESKKLKKISVDIRVIGVVHSPYKAAADVPLGHKDWISDIEIFQEYFEGLKDIEEFSHLNLFYWLHKSKGYSLTVNPPMDTKPHSLFTTRSPHRPNPIGYSVVELIEKKDNILKVKGLDAIEGTPVIDIKPYIKKSDSKPNAISGWLEKKNL